MSYRSGPGGQPGATAFVLLTFGWSWPVWIITWLATGRPATTTGSPAMVAAIYAGSFGPGLAAAILSAASGRAALAAWLRAFIRFRCGWRGYAAAALPLPLALLLLTVALGYVPRVGSAHPSALAFYATIFPVSLLNGLATALLGAGPLGEEGGWRGYLLPKLLARGGEAGAALRVGLMWTVWHLPIMALFADWRGGVPFAPYLLLYLFGLLGLSWLLARVRALAGGSLVPCIWLHGIINAAGGVTFDPRLWTSRWSATNGVAHFAAAAWLAAGIAVLASRQSARVES